MNAATIRRADKQDLPSLCNLYVEFHEFHVRGVPDRLRTLGNPSSIDNSEMYESLEKIMADRDSAILVAEISNTPIGLAHVYIRHDEASSSNISRRYGYLQSLMVLESFRRHGIGTQLVESAEQWAKEKGATEMRLDTWEFANSPLPFYERIGYRTLKRILVRAI